MTYNAPHATYNGRILWWAWLKGLWARIRYGRAQ